jgi:hypothetical protein
MDAEREKSAPGDVGWRSLFTGIDLSGFASPEVTAQTWKAENWHLTAVGAAALMRDIPGAEWEVFFDLALPAGTDGLRGVPTLTLVAPDANGAAREVEVPLPWPSGAKGWQRFFLRRSKDSVDVGAGRFKSDGGRPVMGGTALGAEAVSLRLDKAPAGTRVANLFVRDL